jgi:aspartate aminotransferase-like enzyme
MGYITETDILTTIAVLGMALAEMGYRGEPGVGVEAAEEVLLEGRDRNPVEAA